MTRGAEETGAAAGGAGGGGGTFGRAGGLARSSFRSFAAKALSCFVRPETAASFAARAAEPRLVVRVTATAPRTAATATIRATRVTLNLCMPLTLGSGT